MVWRQQPRSTDTESKIPPLPHPFPCPFSPGSVVARRQSSHTTDGTPTSQPAGWSCLTAKTAARNTESQITVAEGSADAERCCFPISVEISDGFVFRKQQPEGRGISRVALHTWEKTMKCERGAFDLIWKSRFRTVFFFT